MFTHTLRCRQCGKLFHHSCKVSYCSQACREAVKQKVCEQCGKLFGARKSFSRFCSTACRRKSERSRKSMRRSGLGLYGKSVKSCLATCNICLKEKKFTDDLTLQNQIEKGRPVICHDCYSIGVEVVCRGCQQPFTTHDARQVYCSKECCYKNSVTVLKCIECNSTFELRKARGSKPPKYPVCKECMKKPVKCEFCGTEFYRRRSFSRHCSVACSITHSNKKKRGYRVLDFAIATTAVISSGQL